jgi:hypothetical protein
MANRCYENVAQFRYLGTTITNKNLIQEEIKRILNSGSVCYHSVQNLLSCPVTEVRSSEGPNRVGVFPHLRMETDPVSETLFFFHCYLGKIRTMDKFQKPKPYSIYFGRVFLMLKYADITQNTYI